MDIAQLVIYLDDLVLNFENIDGYLFVRRQDESVDKIRAKIATYASTKEAQSWINIVLIESFIDEVAGDEWSFKDPSIGALLSIYEQSWVTQIMAYHRGIKYKIERIVDPELGDLGLRLIQD